VTPLGHEKLEVSMSVQWLVLGSSTFLTNLSRDLIVQFCILLCVYPLMLFSKPPYATMFFVLDFIVHYLLHVLVPIGGHLQVICT
jgi:hypothetical protein